MIATKIKTLLVFLFIFLLLLKDFIGVYVPGGVFMIIWICFLLFADRSSAAAFSLASVICFASTMSITIPVALFILMTIFRQKSIRINAIALVSIYVIIIEFLRFLGGQDENFRQYVNSMSIVSIVWCIVMDLYERKISPFLCIKYYLIFFCIMSLDIVWATAKSLGGIMPIISGSFRIGQVDMIDDTLEGILSVNANGLALMSIIAVSSVMILFTRKQLAIKPTILLLVYFSVIGFLTVSKTFILVYVAFWCFYLYSYISTISKKKIWKPMLLVPIVIVMILTLWNTSLIQNIIVRFDSEDVTTGRIDVTFEYLDFMSQNPLASIWGIGLQNVTQKAGLVHVPHNAILEIFVCFGIIGVILYGVYFISLIRMGIRCNRLSLKGKYIFINYIPFIVFFVFIQSLQFLRINYIYASIALIFACLILDSSTTRSGKI